MKISEKILSAVLDKVGIPVLVCRSDLRICSCNSGAACLFGYSPEEMVKKSLPDLSVQYYQANGMIMSWDELPVAKVIDESRPQSGSLVGIQNSSTESVVWTKMDVYPDYGQDGALDRIFISLTDVTNTRDDNRIQRQIKQAKDEWTSTVDAIQDLVIIFDLDGRIVRANKAAHDIGGFRYGELTGKKCYEVFRGAIDFCKDCPVWNSGDTTSVRTGLIRNDILQKTFDVSSTPVFSDDGKVKYLVHTARDVTQQLKDEAEKLRLSAAIEQTSEVVVITDKWGIILYVNPLLSG